jgi:cytoskeleton-associated protein 5|tara:strand:+ start:290 stop:520 length:231 start_codon:yes stop_codon:yes gene_type:complete
LPREDISKKLNSKLLEKYASKDWKIRKEGGEDVLAILKEAKMRIEDNGLNQLLECLKNGMKDSNKVCLKTYIIILG